MTERKENSEFVQLVQKIAPQSKLLRAWKLQGGSSTQVTALEIERPDMLIQKLVVRQYGDLDLKDNPQIAADEFKLLQILQIVGFAAPKPYFFDQTGKIFARPYLVIAYIDGEPEFAPTDLNDLLLQFATYLSRIHHLDFSNLDISFLPELEKIYTTKLSTRPTMLDDSLNEGQIRDVLEAAWPFPQQNRSSLLHGDFWPGNILCKQGKLVSIIDWEDAKRGDPLSDLANARLEILWTFGIGAMHLFTRHYQSMIDLDFRNLPYWDLCAALRPAFRIAEWAANDSIEKAMRAKHHLFITQAFEKIP